MHKKYLILAGGKQDKWKNSLGVTRHTVSIKGEPLIHRTQRLFLEKGATNIFVCCDLDYKDSYVLPTCQYLESPICVGDIYEEALALLYKDYLNYDGITIILYGDCYYSESLIDAIVKDTGETWHLYARDGDSEITLSQWSEMFAWVFDKKDIPWLLECSKKACEIRPSLRNVSVEQTEYITYRLMAHIDPEHSWPEKTHWIEWNDESDDFDEPRDVRLLELYNSENNWKTIWNNRLIDNNTDVLTSLIQADGFDTGYGSYPIDDWRSMVDAVAKYLNINNNTSVLEVGCGSGAFLYQLQSLTSCAISGYDYSNNLINFAKTIIPSGNFLTSDAVHNPFQEKFDIVAAHSVFQYFPTTRYGYKVIEVITKALKPGGKIILMDILDRDKHSLYHRERRQHFLTDEEYQERYKNLKHTFYYKKDLIRVLQDQGFSDIEFLPHATTGYTNSKFTFNITGQLV